MKQVVIENPVLNSPYSEPLRHYRFDDEGITDQVAEGQRRKSSYFIPIPPPKKKGGAAVQATLWTNDRLQENPFINEVRAKVAAWRRAGYPGITNVTRRLLEHWQRGDRERRFFFCQLEAVETAVYVAEVPPRSDTAVVNLLRERDLQGNSDLYRVAFMRTDSWPKTYQLAPGRTPGQVETKSNSCAADDRARFVGVVG